MNVSVIIPAYNAAATLPAGLKALQSQDYRGPLEVIIVDDGSSDDTAAIVSRFKGVKCIRQVNAGPAAARNAGAKAASGAFLCFTDSDCVPHSDWISLLLKGFTNNDIAAVCGSYGIANPESLLARGIQAEILFRHRYLMPPYPKVFGSYNFCIKKEFFDVLNGFDGCYRNASGEDNDLSYRLIAKGWKIYFEPKALVDHYHTTQVGKYLREQFRHGYWRMRMYAHHPQMAAGDGYTFWKDIVEVPASGACLSLWLMSLAGRDEILAISVLIAMTMFVMELVFACRVMKDIFESFFYASVMFARAFARAFGLSTGFFQYFTDRIVKNFK